jgi:hypothetical protein
MSSGQQRIDQDLGAFRDLSLWLFNGHQKPWEWKGEAYAIYEEISRAYYSIANSEELERFLPNEEEVRSEFQPRKYLYLNPVEGLALVPILTISSDFGRSIPELRMRLGLFSLHDGKPRWFGYRFESPEGPGKHHYYHVQPITDLRSAASFLEAEGPLSTKCPTFPLDADNPVKLLLSLLISLYGLSCIPQIKRQVHGIDRYLDEMHFGKLPEWKWYRKVIMPNGKVAFHDTSDLDAFDEQMKAKYRKCEVTGVTKGRYHQSIRPRKGLGKR